MLGTASVRAKDFNQSSLSPKDKLGKVKQFEEWTLNDFINVARDLGLVGEDVKKFSHALRDFRNYIHPFQQMASKFNPDQHTAKICWQVLQAPSRNYRNRHRDTIWNTSLVEGMRATADVPSVAILADGHSRGQSSVNPPSDLCLQQLLLCAQGLQVWKTLGSSPFFYSWGLIGPA